MKREERSTTAKRKFDFPSENASSPPRGQRGRTGQAVTSWIIGASVASRFLHSQMAMQMLLWRFQSLTWHLRLQYQSVWHLEQRISASAWQTTQVGAVSSSGVSLTKTLAFWSSAIAA